MKTYYTGQTASFTKTIAESDVYLFAGITGDMNPVHINAEHASGTRFKGRIAHGILSAGLISNVLGTQLPGPGCVYLGQTLKFVAPVFIGDTITAKVTIQSIDTEKRRAILLTECKNHKNEIVITGEAKVLLP